MGPGRADGCPSDREFAARSTALRRQQRALYRQELRGLDPGPARDSAGAAQSPGRNPAGPDRNAGGRRRVGGDSGTCHGRGPGRSCSLPYPAFLRIMAAKAPSFTLGIEEEYLLVDRQTRDIVPDPPDDMLTACEAVA